MNLRRLVWLSAMVLFVALIVIGCSKKVPPKSARSPRSIAIRSSRA